MEEKVSPPLSRDKIKNLLSGKNRDRITVRSFPEEKFSEIFYRETFIEVTFLKILSPSYGGEIFSLMSSLGFRTVGYFHVPTVHEIQDYNRSRYLFRRALRCSLL